MGSIEKNRARWEDLYRGLEDEIRKKEAELTVLRKKYGGLQDVDLTLSLVRQRMRLAVLGLGTHLERGEDLRQLVARGVSELDALLHGDVSEDSLERIIADPVMDQIRELVHTGVVTYGEAFFGEPSPDVRRARHVKKRAMDAIWKFCGRNSGGVDVEPGEEETLVSESMAVPLSQAILLLEEEFIPQVEKDLEETPGDPWLQQRLDDLTTQLEVYKKATFFPRSRPVIPEKDLFTTAISGYAANGELLVNIQLPTYLQGKNREDRIRREFKAELVKNLAGGRTNSDLDTAFKESFDLESGRDGSWFEAGGKLEPGMWYGRLMSEYPLLAALDEPNVFSRGLEAAETGGRAALEDRVDRLVLGGGTVLEWLFAPEDEELPR